MKLVIYTIRLIQSILVIALIISSCLAIYNLQFDKYYYSGKEIYLSMYFNIKKKKENQKKELELKLLKLQIKKLENER